MTQNVDGLHQQAGSKNVVELHGNLLHSRCSKPACDLAGCPDAAGHLDAVPLCPQCGRPLRPDVVLLGEDIPALPSWTVKRALRDSNLFIAVGTSGLVTPAANGVRGTAYAGACTVLINLEPMNQPNPASQEHYLGRAEELLPRLLGLSG